MLNGKDKNISVGLSRKGGDTSKMGYVLVVRRDDIHLSACASKPSN